MTVFRALKYYLKSKTNLLIGTMCSVGIIGSVFFRAGAFWTAVPCILYLILTGALFFSKRGAIEILRERDEDQLESGRGKMAAAAATRNRLGVMRIPDKEAAKALEYYLLVSGMLLESAGKEGKYLPTAVENIEQVYAACGAFLTELDQSSMADRYGTQAPVEKPDLIENAVKLIRAAARRLEELRRIELPAASDLDSIIQMEMPDG